MADIPLTDQRAYIEALMGRVSHFYIKQDAHGRLLAGPGPYDTPQWDGNLMLPAILESLARLEGLEQ